MGSPLSCARRPPSAASGRSSPSPVPEARPRVQGEPVRSEVACVWQVGACVRGGTLYRHIQGWLGPEGWPEPEGWR